MLAQRCQQDSGLPLKFSFHKRILMSITLFGTMAIGLYGTFVESVTWGMIYTLFLIFGTLVLFGYCLCSHCPYAYKYSDCLFKPFERIVLKIYKYRPEPMGVLDKFGFMTMIVGMVLIPQYCLFRNYIILIIFWTFFLTFLALSLLYTCRQCRHLDCPFNFSI